jgi:hypothetical protein
VASLKIIQLASFAFLLICSVTQAADQPIVVRIERSEAGILEQNALVLDTSRTKVTRNSNFVCGPQKETFLGSITQPSTKSDQSEYKYLTEIKKRTKKSSPSDSENEEMFRWKTYLGEFEATHSNALNSHLIRSIKDLCDWTPTATSELDVTVIFISKNGENLVMKSTHSQQLSSMKIADAQCISDKTLKGKPYLRCVVPKVGVAYLDDPKSNR